MRCLRRSRNSFAQQQKQVRETPHSGLQLDKATIGAAGIAHEFIVATCFAHLALVDVLHAGSRYIAITEVGQRIRPHSIGGSQGNSNEAAIGHVVTQARPARTFRSKMVIGITLHAKNCSDRWWARGRTAVEPQPLCN